MKTKRRSKNINAIQEDAIKASIERMLEFRKNLGQLHYERTNAGIAYISGRKIYLGHKGTSDFKVWLPQGKVLHLEIKTATGILNKNQKIRKQEMESLGHKYYIARSVADVENILREFI